MLKILRRRFVLISMALVFLVMTSVLLAGIISNRLQFTRDYESALRREQAKDVKGQPHESFRTNLPVPGQPPQRPTLTFTAVRSNGAWHLVTPWMQVDADTLDMLCQRAQDASASSGFWPDLGIAYARQEGRIAFVNLQSEQAQLRSSQWTWGLVYLGALALFFLLALLLSRSALRPVETAWAQQQRFVSDASHELKTPLTVILANLDILENERGGSQWLTAARTEGLMMKKLIENLLFLAHSDEARQPLRREKVSLSDIASETVLAMEALAYEKNLALHSDILPAQMIQGDADLLRRMLGILLDNAVKYTPAGGSIRVTLGKSRDKLALTVHNSKAYIPPEHLAHIFDRFYRMDAARSKGEGGYGLGLSIAAQIARRHGGVLRAYSQEGSGTRFVFTV